MAKSSRISRLESNEDGIKKEKSDNMHCPLKKRAKCGQLHLEVEVMYYPSLLSQHIGQLPVNFFFVLSPLFVIPASESLSHLELL